MENSAMFNHMDYVYSVYKERSFSKAAEALHISQPSLSATIQKIEEQVGAPIFDQTYLAESVRSCIYPAHWTDSGNSGKFI